MQISDAIRRYRNQLLAQGASHHTVRGAKSALNQLEANRVSLTLLVPIDARAGRGNAGDLGHHRLNDLPSE